MGDDQDDAVEEKLQNDDRINFKVYDMPLPLVQEYTSMAKLHYNNEVWRVLADAMELLKAEQQGERRDLEERVEELEARVAMLQAQVDHGDDIDDTDDDGPRPTMGEARDNDTDAVELDKLESLNQES